MDARSFTRLVLLSAIWGGSFLFLVGCKLRTPLDLAKNWKHYVVLGFFNTALPFLLFGFAARALSASLMSILNATAPMWGALIGVVWAGRSFSGRTLLGLLLGVMGVGVLVGFDAQAIGQGALPEIAACLGSTLCYGISTHYAATTRTIVPFANAHGSMWAAVLMLGTLLPLGWPATMPGLPALAAGTVLGVLCSGVAYLLYFRLVKDVGATSTLTVTYLIPVFGVLWGSVFLSEPIHWHTFAGAGVVFLGTALVTGFNPLALLRRQARAN